MTKLADFRADAKPTIPTPVEDRMEIVVRRTESLLVVDQALAASGWAYILMSPEKGFQVAWTGTEKTEQIASGHEDTLLRADSMFRSFQRVITTLAPKAILHETPPVGSMMSRPESSLVAASVLRCAAGMANIPIHMIGAQKAKKRITGNGNAKKTEVAAKLRLMLPSLAQKKPMNQHILDAIALAVVYAEESE